jgi:membrane protein DedA with SNARE-associated domain
VFVLVAAESAGMPLPGETALVAGAVLAAMGSLEIGLVIALAVLGAVAGDNIGSLVPTLKAATG